MGWQDAPLVESTPKWASAPLVQQEPAAPEEPSYLDRVGQAYSDSVKPAAARLMAPFIGEQGRQDLRDMGDLPSGKPQNLAQSINQGPVGAASGALYSMFAPIAPLVQDVVGAGADAVGATPSQMQKVQAAMNIIGPAGMRGISNALGSAEVPSVPTSVKNLAKDTSSGKNPSLAMKARENFVSDLVQEKPTPANIRENALKYKSGGGLSNKTKYVPDAREQAVIQTVSEIPGVKSGNLISENLAAVNAAKNAEAESLKTTLENYNIQVRPSDLQDMGARISANLDRNPLIKKGGTTVTDTLKLAQKAIDKNPKTAAGLLQARKDFDYAIKEFQPSALDTSAPATALRYTAKQVRQGINDTIDNISPYTDVKESLMRQNHMYQALDSMATKLPEQVLKKPNRFARAAQGKTAKAIKIGAGVVATGGGASYLYNQAGAK